MYFGVEGNSGHSRTECKHGVVISQCRCASPNKTIHIGPCPDRCPQKDES